MQRMFNVQKPTARVISRPTENAIVYAKAYLMAEPKDRFLNTPNTAHAHNRIHIIVYL